jgi:hypothetical protein
MMRELRIWKEYRSDEQLFIQRNIEITQMQGLLHYFKMNAETDILRLQETDVTKGTDGDILLSNAKPFDSPLRFKQDLGLTPFLLICPFSTFANLHRSLL